MPYTIIKSDIAGHITANTKMIEVPPNFERSLRLLIERINRDTVMLEGHIATEDDCKDYQGITNLGKK